MENIIVAFFKRYSFLHLGDMLDLYKISSFKSFKAGDLIAGEGDLYPYVIAIRKGIIKTYILKSNGEEKTVRFAKEGDFTSCAETFIREKPSREFLEVVEDCNVILFDSRKFKSLTNDNIRLLRLWNNAIMEAFLEAISRIEFFVTLSPEERYIQLLEKSPELINRVPQKHLASYIGITTVSLSRIRARVTRKS